MRKTDDLVSPDYWDSFHSGQPRLRLPSALVISTRNLHRLLRRYVSPGMRVLEIGFAPGKHLAYVGKVLGAAVTGVDYSENGVRFARLLFQTLRLAGDLRCEDIFATSLRAGTFDFVYSVGVIEHFADPSKIVRCHAELLRPGGTSLILIPNYRGLYGRLQAHFDPGNLQIHNLDIMASAPLAKLAPNDLTDATRTYRVGRIDPSQVNSYKKWPAVIAKSFNLLLTAIGHLQPIDIDFLCPWLALEMRRR